MTQDCWPSVDGGVTIPPPTTASPIGRVKRHLTTTSGTAEEPHAETVHDTITTSTASPLERVKWLGPNTADRSLQNETIRIVDDHPLIDLDITPPSTIESNYQSKSSASTMGNVGKSATLLLTETPPPTNNQREYVSDGAHSIAQSKWHLH
jgi:hypothetical protein